MNPLPHILIFVIQAYRWTISPVQVFLFGGTGGCRFTPTCSVYAMDAIREHGALTGGVLVVKRICRCHPWGGCGHDPVSKAESGKRSVAVAGHSNSRPPEGVRYIMRALPIVGAAPGDGRASTYN